MSKLGPVKFAAFWIGLFIVCGVINFVMLTALLEWLGVL